jgi:hypothetical protein
VGIQFRQPSRAICPRIFNARRRIEEVSRVGSGPMIEGPARSSIDLKARVYYEHPLP